MIKANTYNGKIKRNTDCFYRGEKEFEQLVAMVKAKKVRVKQLERLANIPTNTLSAIAINQRHTISKKHFYNAQTHLKRLIDMDVKLALETELFNQTHLANWLEVPKNIITHLRKGDTNILLTPKGLKDYKNFIKGIQLW